MDKKKKSLTPREIRLKKESVSLIDSAKIIATSSDPVKLIGECIRYDQLATKLYKKNLRVK